MPVASTYIRSAALALATAAAVTATAQSTFKGRVENNQKQPIGFANILLVNPVDSSFIAGAVSREDGSFTLTTPATVRHGLLKISSTGYATTFLPLPQGGDLGTVTLKDEVFRLKGATVTAQRPTFALENGGITANVENSPLARETSTNDVLRKLPGMVLKDGKVQTFNGDEPTIYLNGKKVTDYSLVKNLPVKDIKSVRLLTNPGAEYDASTKCVLLISTKSRLQGLSAQIDLEGARNHRNSHSEGANLSYTTGKATLFASVNYSDSRLISIQDTYVSNTLEKETYLNKLNSLLDMSTRRTDYTLGFNYDINEKNHWGVEYSGSTERTHSTGYTGDSTFVNGRLHDSVMAPLDQHDNTDTHHVNAFYTGTFNEKAGFRLYADYLYTKSDSDNKLFEQSTATATRTVTTLSGSNYKVYAARGVWTYAFSPAHSLSAGAEYSYTNGVSTVHYTYSPASPDDKDYPANTLNIERKAAGFAEYSFRKGRFSLTAGMRYEYVNTDLSDRLEASNNLHRDYSNFLPSLSLNYTTSRQVSHSLTFRSSVDRPAFEWLSGMANYINRYMRQVGNTKLQPWTTYKAGYTFLYKDFMLQAAYSYVKDNAFFSMDTDKDNPAVILASMQNYDKTHRITAMAAWRHKWGCYEPSISAGLYKDFLKTTYLGRPTKSGAPIVSIDWNNALTLPAGFFLNAEYAYQSGGTYMFTTLRATHQVNLSLQKTFFGDRLAITLESNDLLNKASQRLKGGIGTVYLDQDQNWDTRNVSLHLTWRFNAKNRKEYKGKSAADSELQRLKSK